MGTTKGGLRVQFSRGQPQALCSQCPVCGNYADECSTYDAFLRGAPASLLLDHAKTEQGKAEVVA